MFSLKTAKTVASCAIHPHLLHSTVNFPYTQGMATLHKVIEETQSIGKWASITILSFLALLLIIRVGGSIKEYFFPTPSPPPTVTYGKLPELLFPKSVSDQVFSYTINTVSGALPVLADRVIISPLAKNSPSLLALQRAEEKVAKAGFSTKSTAISETLYKWTEIKPPFRTLIMDIVSSNFNIATNGFLPSDVAPDEALAKDAVTGLLAKMSLFPNDIDESKTKTAFLMLGNEGFVPATSQSNANATRVDLFQKNINDLSIYYPNPPYSTMNFIVVKNGFDYQIIDVSFTHFYAGKKSGTYPIKTAKEAFSQLQNGNAYIALYLGNDNSIQIKNVSLGYYLGENQKYLMPVIIFEGSNNFIAYISAVTDTWIDK